MTLQTFREWTQGNALNESSLSRVYQHYMEHSTGTITAFRSKRECGTGEDIPLKENKSRNIELKRELLKLGYGVTTIAGKYIENYGKETAVEVSEESFFVVDLKDKGRLKADLIKLGGLYEQDSITFAEKGGDYYLISTNKCEDGYPGEGKVGVEVKLGKPVYGEGKDENAFFFQFNTSKKFCI